MSPAAPRKRGGWRRKLHIGLAVFWSIALSWMWWSMQATGFSDEVLESDAAVRVERGADRIVFRPWADPADAALLFFPGALADPDAYAPLARGAPRPATRS